MDQNDIDSKIGEAWKAHYQGQNEVALEKFLKITQDAPDNVDAFWGLGLTYRRLGDRENALEVFQKVQDLVVDLLETEGGQRGRYFMLNRMVSQQIEQMDDFSG